MSSCERFAELVPLQALGLLPEDEARQCGEHVTTCAACAKALASFEEINAEMTPIILDQDPPPDLKARLMNRVTRNAAPAAATPFTFVHAATSDGWAATGVEGVEKRTLYEDPLADRQTVLFRMAPGSSYPAHRHADVEECWVLSGDLSVGEIVMHEGDYQRAESGSEHPVQSTMKGCTLLVVCSLADERI